jgi:hypothetical protein
MPKKPKPIDPTFTFLSPAAHAELEHAMQCIQRKLEASDPAALAIAKPKGDLDYLDDPRLKYAFRGPRAFRSRDRKP